MTLKESTRVTQKNVLKLSSRNRLPKINDKNSLILYKNKSIDNMASSSELNVVVDVVVPVVFIIALCVMNCFVLRYIMSRRREYEMLLKTREGPNALEGPTTSAAAAAEAATPTVATPENEDSCSIEMERL